jgi:hypothetical protein
MIVYLLLATVMANHTADLELKTAEPMDKVSACVVQFYDRPLMSARLIDRDHGVSIAVGMVKIANRPKPYWVFDIEDKGAYRVLTVGFNYTKNPSNAEKTLRKIAARCAPEPATSVPPPPAQPPSP